MIDEDRLITDWILPVIAVAFLFSFFKESPLATKVAVTVLAVSIFFIVEYYKFKKR